MQIYSLICNTFGKKFDFNAIDQNDAVSKAKDWCLYQGHCFREDYKVESFNGNRLDLQNEWISRGKR